MKQLMVGDTNRMRPMTKSAFLKAVKYQRNEVRIVGATKIANVAWLNKPWLIIENDETLEDASKTGFVPIDHFRTAIDLYEAHKNVL